MYTIDICIIYITYIYIYFIYTSIIIYVNLLCIYQLYLYQFDQLAVCITVTISAVVACPIVFNTSFVLFLFINKRWLLKLFSYKTCCGLSGSK